jgi:hypothetical protein
MLFLADRINSGPPDVEPFQKQVYGKPCREMPDGRFSANTFISRNKIIEQVNISTRLLPDAAVQLKSKGRRTLFYRRGILPNKLSACNMKYSSQVSGALKERRAVKNPAARRGSDPIAPLLLQPKGVVNTKHQ